MLAMSDIQIDGFLPLFSDIGVSVAFLVPTPTGYGKSIMDAIGPVRTLLKDEGIHDYEAQKQGQEAKVMWESYFVLDKGLIETEASLYRPVTKKGDPRIWFKGLRQYCSPCNLLALFIYERKIYVMNLSSKALRDSIEQKGFVFDLLQQVKYSKRSVAMELLGKLKAIHQLGFIPSITSGDPGVGDTLENALGISRNNLRTPDYKGIELKSTRLTRHGSSRAKTRVTLFTRVPDAGLTYREIVETYGKWQIPRGQTTERFQLVETLSTQRVNSYGLSLGVNESRERLEMLHGADCSQYVSSWQMQNLRSTVLLKHHETFWVKAQSIDRGGREYFRYDKVLHTKNPNVSLLEPLFDTGKITLDLAAYFKEDGKWRDHGMLFKMRPDEISLLLGEPVEYDLEEVGVIEFNGGFERNRRYNYDDLNEYGSMAAETGFEYNPDNNK